MNYYTVGIVSKTQDLNFCGFIQPLKLSWIDGQVGAMPVFTNKHKAKKYIKSTGQDLELLQFKVEEKGE